jgi:hypothetical protein
VKRLAPLLVACLAALAAAGQAAAIQFPCGLPAGQPLWIEFSDGSVHFRQALFGRPGVVVATNGVERAAEMRALGAHTVYWHMFLKGLAGTPTVPHDPALVVERTRALIEKARASTGCATPLIGLNELFGASRRTPWPPEVVQYRTNVLEVLRMLSEAGAQPFLLVPGQARGTRSPWVGDAAGDWWREVSRYAFVVRQMHFNAPYVYRHGPIVGPRLRRTAMRDAISAFTGLGIPADRLGLLLGFQSGPGKGGREGLAPTSAWTTIVKQDALAAKHVAAELGLSTIWSWGWGTFNAAGADPDKPAAACVYLWTRNPSLCDGPSVAGEGFDPSLTVGQIILPAGAQCSTDPGVLSTAAVDRLTGVTGDTSLALSALLTGIVLERLGGAVSPADVARAEELLVAGGFGGNFAAYEAELASRGLDRTIAQDVIAHHFRRQTITASLAVAVPNRFPPAWIATHYRDAYRSAVCLNDRVPGNKPFSWSGLLPFLDLPPASISIGAEPRAVEKGGEARLSGGASSARAQEVVTVYRRRPEAGAWTRVGDATVAADGSWSLQLRGLRRTEVYRAVSLGAVSRSVSIRVRGRDV